MMKIVDSRLCLWLLLVGVATLTAQTSASLSDATDLTDLDSELKQFDDDDDFTAVEDLTETGRFAFITVNSDGSVSFTFNATSAQRTLAAGAALLGIGILFLPLLGLLGLIGIGKKEEGYGSDEYSYPDPTAGAYSAPVAAAAYAGENDYQSQNSYSGFAKRSLSWMAGPIMQALAKTYKKYEESHHDD